MSTITTRAGKGTPLTHNEVDANFTNLNSDKYEAGDSPSFVNVTVTGTVDGRDVSVDGAKLDGIEAGADVTDTANVTAAGALMDSEVTNLADVKAFDPADYVAQTALTGSAVLPSGTTAERDGSPNAGYIRFNSTDGTFEGYDGTAWGAIGGADFSSVGEDILPATDVTYDLGSSTFTWHTGFFDNISDGTDTVGTEYVVNGSAKAWAHIDVSGGVPSLADSINATSVTDLAVGRVGVNFTNAMANSNFSAPASSSTFENGAYGATTTSVNLYTNTSGGVAQDPADYSVAVLGDLA